MPHNLSRSSSDDVEWTLVTEKLRCPVCESAERCHRHSDDTFASCAHEPSDWPLTNGSWLHRVERLPSADEAFFDLATDLASHSGSRP